MVGLAFVLFVDVELAVFFEECLEAFTGLLLGEPVRNAVNAEPGLTVELATVLASRLPQVGFMPQPLTVVNLLRGILLRPFLS